MTFLRLPLASWLPTPSAKRPPRSPRKRVIGGWCRHGHRLVGSNVVRQQPYNVIRCRLCCSVFGRKGGRH